MIEITRLAKTGGPLTKRISLSADGSLEPDGSACERVHLDGLNQFADLIQSPEPGGAIAQGGLRGRSPGPRRGDDQGPPCRPERFGSVVPNCPRRCPHWIPNYPTTDPPATREAIHGVSQPQTGASSNVKQEVMPFNSCRAMAASSTNHMKATGPTGPTGPIPENTRVSAGFAKGVSGTRCCRSTGPAPIAFALVNAAALRELPAMLARWLPDGRVMGREYEARNPRRNDRSPGSFRVNLRTGRWADFATGDCGGDPVSLVAYLFAVSQREAARRLANMLGVQ